MTTHWNDEVLTYQKSEEWLYFHEGEGRATVFIGQGNARTFDFSAGDTAVFPDNSGKKSLPKLLRNTLLMHFAGHYIENTSATKNLTWIELYKSDRVADIPLTQWLALTPADIVAAILKIDISVVEKLKKQKQVLIKGT